MPQTGSPKRNRKFIRNIQYTNTQSGRNRNMNRPITGKEI